MTNNEIVDKNTLDVNRAYMTPSMANYHSK